MNHQQFDALTRGIAHDQTRRGFVRGFAALFAAVLMPRAASAAVQSGCPDGCPEGEVCLGGVCRTPCENHRDCRSKHDDPCLLNTCVEGYCVSAIADCLPGFVCCKGECCPQSCESDAECAVFDPCRRGECAPDGYCSFVVYSDCDPCTSDFDCATGHGHNTVCCAGMCKRPCPTGTVMGKGCECRADSSGTQNGLVVRDDASG